MLQLSLQRPIAYEDESDIFFELVSAGKRYCDLLVKIIKKSHPCIVQGKIHALPPGARLLLQVQGTEIVAAACANMNMKIVYAVNKMLIDRLDTVLDTCYHIKAVNREPRILNCLFRQVNAAFAVNGSLGVMLYKGYELWDRLRSRVLRYIPREDKNLQHPNPVVRILLCMCHENRSRCDEYKALKSMMERMAIERVEISPDLFPTPRLIRALVSAPYPKHQILLFQGQKEDDEAAEDRLLTEV